MEINQKEIAIKHYDTWMLPCIAEIHKNEYGSSTEEEKMNLQKGLGFFDDSFKEKHLVLVAVTGDIVIGTQTYKYWPYRFGDKHYYSLQSGATLVDPAYRGRGLFARMLQAGNTILQSRMADFIIGFPVAMSYGGFIKDQWIPLGHPRWFTYPINCLNILQKKTKNVFMKGLTAKLSKSPEWPEGFKRFGAEGRVCLESNKGYLTYRYSGGRNYYYFVFDLGGATFMFICKSKMTHGFLEIVIGDILTDINYNDYNKLYKAISYLINAIKQLNEFDAISILINSKMTRLAAVLVAHMFVPLWKTVRFIIKPLNEQANHKLFSDYELWPLMNADIDTW